MIAKLITKLRSWINDAGTSDTFVDVYKTSLTFTLSESANSVSAVYVNDVATENYTFSSTTNTVTIEDSLVVNDVIKIVYVYYKYSDTELTQILHLAVGDLAINSAKGFQLETDKIYPIPSLAEQDLICKIATYYADCDYTQFDTPNLKVRKETSGSRDKKITILIDRFYSGDDVFGNMEI